MAGRPTETSKLGLTVVTDLDDPNDPSGTWWALVTDDSGETLFHKTGYTSDKSAKNAVASWARKNYGKGNVEQHPKDPPHVAAFRREAAKMRSLADKSADAAKKLRDDADRHDRIAAAYDRAAAALEESANA